MDLSAYNTHPHLRQMFVELASEVALNRECAAGSSRTFRVREPVVEPTARWVDFGVSRAGTFREALRNCPKCGSGA